MADITVLDQSTINKIAAGEVVERPASVVKELLENAIDAQATAVTIEIKDGGCAMVRVTDNGSGIPKDQIPLAFLRHATSKIRSVEDLFTISSLGFRGEALASIAAVAQVELISKTSGSLTGSRYQIEGGEERGFEEVGAPDGTTFIARNLFYNTPARKKFLKTSMTEGAHVAALVEKIALSHPDISIRFIQNNQNKLYTSGNHNLRDLIYTVFGREIAANLLEVDVSEGDVRVTGFIGKPVIARSNRNYENYFINGRYIRSNVISKGIEEAYKPFMMQHKYPFTMLHFTIQPDTLDVNVHPTKMELRFSDGEGVFQSVVKAVSDALAHKELIPEVELIDKREQESAALAKRLAPGPEPFEVNRREGFRQKNASVSYSGMPLPGPSFVNERAGDWMKGRGDLEAARVQTAAGMPENGQNGVQTAAGVPGNGENGVQMAAGVPGNGQNGVQMAAGVPGSGQNGVQMAAGVPGNGQNGMPMGRQAPGQPDDRAMVRGGQQAVARPGENQSDQQTRAGCEGQPNSVSEAPNAPVAQQMDLFDGKLLDPKARLKHKLIGQLFDTYWMVEYNEQLFIIDQHAAHEKVLYEKTVNMLKTRQYDTQMVEPPIILTLNMNEEVLLDKYLSYFTGMGFEIEPFGGREHAVRGVPANLFSIARKDLLIEMIDSLSDDLSVHKPDIIYEKVASMSCKAAVKGRHTMSAAEANELIDQLLDLENPYACPHGRPTIVSMTKYELEKKFKRIV